MATTPFVILFLTSFISSIIATKILTYLMPKLKVIDLPAQRRIHQRATPRGGGLSLVIIFSLFIVMFEYFTVNKLEYSILILQAFIPIASISFWDDVAEVKIAVRLACHLLCSGLVIMWLIHPAHILYDELPIYFDLAVGTLALATFLNIYNFMDGIDGIAVMEAIHLTVTMLALSFIKADIINNVGFIILANLIILGWSLGFLLFNWHPAKIFLGDVGSISLGFLLGSCLLMIASSSAHLFLACVIASLYYVADGGLTIMIRIAEGEKIWQPHLKHFFQKAIKKGLKHNEAVSIIIYCNICLLIFAINSLYYPVTSTILALITVTYTLIRLVK